MPKDACEGNQTLQAKERGNPFGVWIKGSQITDLRKRRLTPLGALSLTHAESKLEDRTNTKHHADKSHLFQGPPNIMRTCHTLKVQDQNHRSTSCGPNKHILVFSTSLFRLPALSKTQHHIIGGCCAPLPVKSQSLKGYPKRTCAKKPGLAIPHIELSDFGLPGLVPQIGQLDSWNTPIFRDFSSTREALQMHQGLFIG